MMLWSWLCALLVCPLLLPVIGQRSLTRECPHSRNTTGLQPLYVLVLVPFPDSRPGSGFDSGLSSLPGGRVARDEVNNHSDLLSGYRIELIEANSGACSLATAPNGIVNLVRFGIAAECHPVLAVAGLICSSHMAEISAVVGRKGVDLIQLGAGNSPVFRLNHDRFSHLWRFLGAATVYSDATLAIMDTFRWRRIALLYTFFDGIAQYFVQAIQRRDDITLVFSTGIAGTRTEDMKEVIKNIRSKGASIILVLLNREQQSLFLCATLDEGITYPHHTWLHVSERVSLLQLESRGSCTREKIARAARGHLFLHTQQEPRNRSELIEVSGGTYDDFLVKYNKELLRVERDYAENEQMKISVPNIALYAGIIYNQVWALALALNHSLPELENRNLSIDSYSIGRPEITEVIERHLENVSFHGAGGYVRFNSYRGVFTSVEIFWVLADGQERHVGTYNPLNTSDYHVDINSSDLPMDAPPKIYILLPLPVTLLFYITAGATMIFTTLLLTLFLRHHKQKEIKASSPYLSLLIFFGCYLLCISVAIEVTWNGFHLSDVELVVLLCINVFIIINGISLILVTIFIKLLRVYRIFFSWMRDLGNFWNNCSLVLIILLLSILPNIVIIVLIAIDRPKREFRSIYTERNSIIVTEEHQQVISNLQYTGILMLYFGLFLLLILFVAFRTRKIRHGNFKDTKKVNFFVAVLALMFCLIIPLCAILVAQQFVLVASVFLAVGSLMIPIVCQAMLFVPKVFPVVMAIHFPQLQQYIYR